MRASRLWTCLALALLGLVWSGSTASAQCKQVYGGVRTGTTFYEAICPSYTYTPFGGGTPVTSKYCTCSASVCTACFSIGGRTHCHTWAANAFCMPLVTVKAP